MGTVTANASFVVTEASSGWKAVTAMAVKMLTRVMTVKIRSRSGGASNSGTKSARR